MIYLHTYCWGQRSQKKYLLVDNLATNHQYSLFYVIYASCWYMLKYFTTATVTTTTYKKRLVVYIPKQTKFQQWFFRFKDIKLKFYDSIIFNIYILCRNKCWRKTKKVAHFLSCRWSKKYENCLVRQGHCKVSSSYVSLNNALT